tara:strand:- start:2477 stop:2779 length:303 start_codon:yes stop_codon:yes gene_type:complete
MIILLTLACAMSMAQEPIEQQSYPIDYSPMQKETQKMLSSIDAIEFFLQDKQDFEKFCPLNEWVQPCLDDYKTEAKSYLPDDCLPEEEKKARAESKAVEP